MMPTVWLHGRIAEGRRARILGMTLQARAVAELPGDSGVLMTTGEDFVAEENRRELLNWMQPPGRVLLVIPPFQAGTEDIPLRWSVQYGEASPEGGSDLASSLAGEVQCELRGDLLTDRIGDMQFAKQKLAVGYYRPRIAAGLLAITVLPLWSVRTVDNPKLLQEWIGKLFALAGKPREAEEKTRRGPSLSPLHFSLLLHLHSRRHETLDAALDSLRNSPIMDIPRERGTRLCGDLAQLGYIAEASLTDRGLEALRGSRYAMYMEPLKESNR